MVDVAQRRCFHETDVTVPLYRRSLAEALGTAMLVLCATGGGMAAISAFAQPGFALPMTALSIAASLVGLIAAFGPVSGGHFNPLISILQWLSGERSLNCAVAYVIAQLAGGIGGGLLAAVLWNHAPMTGNHGSWVGFGSEAVASAGLMLVVFGCARGGNPLVGPLAVGAWLVAAIIALPSASYANPAVVAGAIASSGPVALSKTAAAPYVTAELVGALLAFALIGLVFGQAKSVR